MQLFVYPLSEAVSVKVRVSTVTHIAEGIYNADNLQFGEVVFNNDISAQGRQCLEVGACHFHVCIIQARCPPVKDKR